MLEAPASLAASLGGAVARAHLDEYFGVWAIEDRRFRALAERFSPIGLAAHVAESEPRAIRSAASSSGDGIAIIELRGPLMKQAGSLGEGSSTVAARRAIRQAAADPAVRGIMLVIDSPGGTVAGTKELADEVAAVAARKPVHAYIEDLGASAAYWVASQASRVLANETALVGCIGTFAVLVDSSARAEQLGYKVHVVKAGEHKGAGQPGTEITDEHLADAQRVVDALNEHFLAAVQAGRRMDPAKVRGLADGRVHVGAEARSLGLVDEIKKFEDAMAEMSVAKPSGMAAAGAGTEKTMSKNRYGVRAADEEKDPEKDPEAEDGEEETPEEDDDEFEAEGDDMEKDKEKPASYKVLKASCPGADAEFICSQQEKGATKSQAMRAWMGEQNARLRAANKAPRPARRGADPVRGSQGGCSAAAPTGDPIADFNALVRGKVAQGMSRQKAIVASIKEDHELHQAYLAATNKRSAAGLIAQRNDVEQEHCYGRRR